MPPDDREYLLRANSDWPWVLPVIALVWFVLGVPISGDPFGPGSHERSPQAVSALRVSIPIAGERP
jgi:hypothetical protein